jgi:hypothetical protein
MGGLRSVRWADSRVGTPGVCLQDKKLCFFTYNDAVEVFQFNLGADAR